MSLKKLIESEKGSVMDTFLWPLVVGIMLIVCAILLTILNSFDSGFVDSYWIDVAKNTLQIWDKGMIFIVVMMIIVAVVLASQIETHPMFLIPALILLAVSVYITTIEANIYWAVATSSSFAAATNELPNMLALNSRMALIVLLGGALIAVALYAKPQRDIIP